MSEKSIWVLAKANTLVGHNFNDTVAICQATSKREAVKKFEKYYGKDFVKNHIHKAWFNDGGVSILTDY